jgi:hypothetical protein
MNRRILAGRSGVPWPGQASPARVVLVLLGLAVAGCGPTITVLETQVLPEPKRPAPDQGLPEAYPRSQINDPRLRELAQEFQSWVVQQQTRGTQPAPLFSRVEVLPPTQTVLPYGVGAYQREPRLPAILTTGPGWAGQEPEDKEAAAAQAFRQLSQQLEARKVDPPLRPSLTIQTPSGLELAWITDLVEGRKNIHGDDSQALPTLSPQSPPLPAAPPPWPTAVESGKNAHGDQQ